MLTFFCMREAEAVIISPQLKNPSYCMRFARAATSSTHKITAEPRISRNTALKSEKHAVRHP